MAQVKDSKVVFDFLVIRILKEVRIFKPDVVGFGEGFLQLLIGYIVSLPKYCTIDHQLFEIHLILGERARFICEYVFDLP